MAAVYDVTRRETLDVIATHWLPEVLRNSTYPDAVRMIVANKIDKVGWGLRLGRQAPRPHFDMGSPRRIVWAGRQMQWAGTLSASAC